MRQWTGDEIRQLREANGLTQPELGEILGVDKDTVSRWGLRKLSPNESRRILLNILSENPAILADSIMVIRG